MLSHFHKTFDVTPFVMEALCTLSTHFVPQITFNSAKFRTFCASSIALSVSHQVINGGKSWQKSVLKKPSKVKARVSDTQLKENWLESLSCSSQEKVEECKSGDGGGVEWVIGVDPDVSGALALLKSDGSGWGCSAQVFDSPYLQVLVGKKALRRLDAKSIAQLVRSFGAPLGTNAYIEQSLPFPQDGKQGWWGGGFGYGMWIGILVASRFSVVPVPSFTWKKHFELSGSHLSKDDSRKAACTLFPSLSSQLTRKKDHGRAEALLIAAFGKGLQLKCDSSTIEESENGVADELT